MSRARYTWKVSRAGWRQLVEVSNHIGALLLVLLLVGLSVGSAVRFPHWWIGLIVFAAGYFLLFIEGSYQLQQAATTRLDELQRQEDERQKKPEILSSLTVKPDVRYGRTLRASWKNTSAQEVPAGDLFCMQVPASWGVEIDGNTWNVAHGDDVHNIHQPSPYKLLENMAVVHDIPIPSDVHGLQTIVLLVPGTHRQEHEIDVDA